MPRASTIVAVLLWSAFAFAQQTGHLEGTVTVIDGPAAAGIHVVAESDTMPRPRSTITDADGRYSLPHLLPGSYRVTFMA